MQGGRKNPRSDFVALDTRDILFIVGGAFTDLDRQVSERTAASSLGFGNPVRWAWSVGEVQESTSGSLSGAAAACHPVSKTCGTVLFAEAQ